MSGNIRAGVSLFGVGGDPNVVDTSTGDAVAGEIASGKKAWVDGREVTGMGVISIATVALVGTTGQTQTHATGDDGDLERGVTWPTPRFTDNGNGTVTDNLTGLIWLKNADCFGLRSWANALTDANGLAHGSCGLTDGSSAGDWRLPNARELQSLVHYGFSNPVVPNTAGTGQWAEGDPFTGVQSYYYWSSTTYAYNTSVAWFVGMYHGLVDVDHKTGGYGVWPVRGGQ